MKRTTVLIEPEIEVLLKIESLRRKEPVSGLIREALSEYLDRRKVPSPPGAGEFDSGRTDTAEKAEEVLRRTGFGRKSGSR
jgi:hypothetical protein